MHEIRTFLILAARRLSGPLRSELALDHEGWPLPEPLRSASTFITFRDLGYDAHYWQAELPLEADLYDTYVRDAAWPSWGPVGYADVAHVLLPRFFTQEITIPGGPKGAPRFCNTWKHEQDLEGLSEDLTAASIEHRLIGDVLEIKRF